MKWVRYEGHGQPVCPDCAEALGDEDEFWYAHADAYRTRGDEEFCHECGTPAPRDE